MAKKLKKGSASDILSRRYYKGKSKERLAEARANIADLELGDKIRRLREQAGLTQAQLADLIRTQPSQVSRIEDADYEGHSVETLRRIAAALHVNLRIEFVIDEAGADRQLQPS